MLAKAERDFLKGKLKPKDAYLRKLRERIRRKTYRALEDLTLVFEKMTPTQLHFYREEYAKTLELFRRIQGNYGILMLSENFEFEEISAALERAQIHYDTQKLFLDDRYRDRMILRVCEKEKRSGLDLWKPIPVEYKRRKFKEWKQQKP
ncbi:hypothetical protein G4O51_13000 [Candidatus Bathyarchaeota archaeon A05DMB-2]|jgi:hypothetical protein|nr:hypothetical protein [Candidatus Bathyarchaeota archaeon A05DMB-2]